MFGSPHTHIHEHIHTRYISSFYTLPPFLFILCSFFLPPLLNGILIKEESLFLLNVDYISLSTTCCWVEDMMVRNDMKGINLLADMWKMSHKFYFQLCFKEVLLCIEGKRWNCVYFIFLSLLYPSTYNLIVNFIWRNLLLRF